MTMLDCVAAVIWADAAFKAASPGGISGDNLPETATLPATLYREVGGASHPTFDTSGMQRQRVEFNCYATDRGAASEARKALIAVLNGYRGPLGDGTFLQAAQLQGPGMSFFDSELRQFRAMCEFYLYFDFQS